MKSFENFALGVASGALIIALLIMLVGITISGTYKVKKVTYREEHVKVVVSGRRVIYLKNNSAPVNVGDFLYYTIERKE